jgi:hypothetical protein
MASQCAGLVSLSFVEIDSIKTETALIGWTSYVASGYVWSLERHPALTNMNKVKVLLLAANPAGTEPLQLDKEIERIAAKLMAAQYHGSVELVYRRAVRPDDLLHVLLEVKPHIVHFSGHGSSAAEIILLDDQGEPKPVSQEALVHLFNTLKDNVRVVVLNACYTYPQAESVAQTIDCTIGMNRAIGDEAAIIFAAWFYGAIGFGRSVKEAFELGRAALLLEDIPEDKTPELLTRPGFDAAGLVLISPPSAAKGTGEQPRVPARVALVLELSGLAPTDWSLVLASIEGASKHVSHNAPIAEQAAQLVRFAESTARRGISVESIREALEYIRNPT